MPRRIMERIYRLQKHGDALYVAIPAEFVRKHSLKKGDEVLVKFSNTEVRVIIDEVEDWA